MSGVKYKCWTAVSKCPLILITGTLWVTFSTHSRSCFQETPPLSCCLLGNKALANLFFFISKLRKGQSFFKHLWRCEENWADLQHFTWAPGLTYICLFLRWKAGPTCDRFHRKLTVTDCVCGRRCLCTMLFSLQNQLSEVEGRQIYRVVSSFQKLLVYNCIDT